MKRTARGVSVEVAELSDPGRDPGKQINEDAVGYFETRRGHLAVVCDGMGGHTAGREASGLAVTTIARELEAAEVPSVAEALRTAITAANHAVFELGKDTPMDLRPGCTCVAALIHEQGAEVAHVGDSRLYWLHRGRMVRVTRDHSMVQQMVDAGVLSEADAAQHPEANKITRALGIAPEVEVEVRSAPLRLAPGDVLLLASDGLTDMLSDEILRSVIESKLPSGVQEVVQTLVRMANDRGGHDNITAQVVLVADTQRASAPTTLSESSDTLVDDPRHPAFTIPAAAPPTLIDEPAHDGARTTEPQIEAHPETTLRFQGPEASDTGRPPKLRQARTVVVAALILCGAIVVGVVLWWALSAAGGPARDDELVPPPPVVESPGAQQASPPTTVLEASVEPEPAPTAAPTPAPTPTPPGTSPPLPAEVGAAAPPNPPSP